MDSDGEEEEFYDAEEPALRSPLAGLGRGAASSAPDHGDWGHELLLDVGQEEEAVSLAPGEGAWVPVVRSGAAHIDREPAGGSPAG